MNFKKIINISIIISFCTITLIGIGVLSIFWKYSASIPDYSTLKDYDPSVTTRVFSSDGKLLDEFAIEERLFVPINQIPNDLINAFISAEDKNFFKHKGVDFFSIIKASITNLKNFNSNRRLVGASTITQQVAKNFFLTNEVSFERKIKEAILSFRIERYLTKEKILELYFNEIYLGYGSYGVASASLNYFNKSLKELSIAENAFLAALPKAPNNYHPIKKKKQAIKRRNWVIDEMYQNKFLTYELAELYKNQELIIVNRDEKEFYIARDFTEEVRKFLSKKYGFKTLYKRGLSVRSTIDTFYQNEAYKVLKWGLEEYDKRHGWRGALTNIGENLNEFQKFEYNKPFPDNWIIALVIAVEETKLQLLLKNEERISLIINDNNKWIKNNKSQILKKGDIIFVEKIKNEYNVKQIPEVNGSLVALDPYTGKVLSLVGGYDFSLSEFNRATQAVRQPGSAFKPFVYLTALENGFSPSTVILDAPYVIDQGPGLPKWKPSNYTKEFYGLSTMRLGIEKSRNLMTIRLANKLGMKKIYKLSSRFGIGKNMNNNLSMALGAGETTLLELTNAYGMIVNSGKKITPSLIDTIQNKNGKIIFKHEKRNCSQCKTNDFINANLPIIEDNSEQIVDPISAYQMVSMLEGVVKRGTGRKINSLNRPLAGKTGTTNESKDAWFVGFSPTLVVGIYVGFDRPKSLGNGETGSSVAVPIFKRYIEKVLNTKPKTPFIVANGVSFVRIDQKTCLPSNSGILEVFKQGKEPFEQFILDDKSSIIKSKDSLSGTGGLILN